MRGNCKEALSRDAGIRKEACRLQGVGCSSLARMASSLGQAKHAAGAAKEQESRCVLFIVLHLYLVLFHHCGIV